MRGLMIVQIKYVKKTIWYLDAIEFDFLNFSRNHPAITIATIANTACMLIASVYLKE